MSAKGEEQLRKLIAEHPDLPIMCLAPSTPCEYDTYYHDVYGASVEHLLFPNEVKKLYGDTFGMDFDRYYNDADEVTEQVLDYWLWDGDHGHELMEEHKDSSGRRHWDYKHWSETYEPIARMMVDDMPWHDYVVIDCF